VNHNIAITDVKRISRLRSNPKPQQGDSGSWRAINPIQTFPPLIQPGLTYVFDAHCLLLVANKDWLTH